MTPKKASKSKSSQPPQSDSDGPIAAQRTLSGHQLVCLSTARMILSEMERDTNDTLNTFIHLVTEGWQYPGSACSRVTIENLCVQSVNFLETPWKLSSDVVTSEGKVGHLEVCYLEEKRKLDEGPFRYSERMLIDALADELSVFAQRLRVRRVVVQQQRELELYASLLRHDLRNDLGVILSNVDLLRMITSKSDGDVQQCLTSIEAVSGRMMNLLKALGRPLGSIERNIAALVRAVSIQAEQAFSGMKVNVVVDEGAEGLRVEESRLLPAVFDNLLRNAGAHAGPTAIVQIHVSRVAGYAQIVVSDNGPGIPESVRDKLFQKGVSTTGGGLGLYLSREIVAGMGGSIELIEPEKGCGATFRIRLAALS